MIGTTLGHYRIVEKIGEGGMGEVYRAHDERLDRDVAIKVIPEEVGEKPDRLACFEREAKAVAKLNHPNILDVYELGDHEGRPFMATELLEGETLRERIDGGALGWRKAAEIGASIADGLAAAHGAEIIHRDLKPDNVFLTSDGHVKILDFGLAGHESVRVGSVDAEAPTLSMDIDAETALGSVEYMSPEQVRGDTVDQRSDIFSLGCVLFEMVFGQQPFHRKNAADTVAAILNETPSEPSSTAAAAPPPGLIRIVRRCLEKPPEARFQSARDLEQRLRSVPSTPAREIERHEGAEATRTEGISSEGDPPVQHQGQNSLPPAAGIVESASPGAKESLELTSGTSDESEYARRAPRWRTIFIYRWVGVAVFMPWVIAVKVTGALDIPIWLLVVTYVLQVGTTVLLYGVHRWSRDVRFQRRCIALSPISDAVWLTGWVAWVGKDHIEIATVAVFWAMAAGLTFSPLITAASGAIVLAAQAGVLFLSQTDPGHIAALLSLEGLLLAYFIVTAGGLSAARKKVRAARLRHERELREANLRLQQQVVEQASALDRSRMLSRYLPPDVVRTVLAEGTPRVSPKRMRLTVFRIELCGFERIVTVVPPEDLSAMLNGYLSAIVEVAFQHGATVDLFMRDTVAGFFGAPHTSGAETDAVRCAKMAKVLWTCAVDTCNRWRDLLEEPPPAPTVAVSSGHAMVGDFGSGNRMEYTAVGGPIDEAAAMLRHASPGQVVCSHSTQILIRDELSADPCGAIQITGRTRPTSIYRLAGDPSSQAGLYHTPTGAWTAGGSEDITIGSRGEPQEGSVLAGRYLVLKKLGSGGIGTVFLVEDKKLDTPVALKLLRESLQFDEESIALLRREVRLARLVSHPNVARIFELMDWEGHEFITMEYVDGRTLAVECSAKGPFSPEQGQLLLRQICAGLSAAHGAGVVHRDLKPSNIQIEPSGRAVILDFGIARSTFASTITDVERIVGTPLYMAPEQFERGTIDARADLYSLGALAFEVFAGRPPFQADSIVALASMHAQETPPDILQLRPDLPPRLAAVIQRCLEKSPDRRFSSAADLAAYLA